MYPKSLHNWPQLCQITFPVQTASNIKVFSFWYWLSRNPLPSTGKSTVIFMFKIRKKLKKCSKKLNAANTAIGHIVMIIDGRQSPAECLLNLFPSHSDHSQPRLKIWTTFLHESAPFGLETL